MNQHSPSYGGAWHEGESHAVIAQMHPWLPPAPQRSQEGSWSGPASLLTPGRLSILIWALLFSVSPLGSFSI